MRKVTVLIALLVFSMITPIEIGSGLDPSSGQDQVSRDTRGGQTLNLTYLNHDAADFGSTAFRVWDDDLVIFIEAFPNETACIWDPESIKEADIIMQAPHGHMSHYDPDEVACVARNTGAYVVGNNELHNDMISRGVDSNKVIELDPVMGGKVTKTITDLNVRITSYGMEHTWMSGVQDNTFLVEMPSGIKWYHGTCTSGSNTENYMANNPELKGLDVMILDFDLIKPAIFNNHYPEYVIKDHDYQTFQATVYNYKQQSVGTLSHNQTFKFTKPDHPPEVVGMEFTPLEGDVNTNFTFTATYKYWYDRPAERAELFLDGTSIPLTTTATSGYRTGVQYTKVMRMAPGDRHYHLELEVDGLTTRVPSAGDVIFHVNHIPELTGPGHDPHDGDTDSTYRFNVTYMDLEGTAPTKSIIIMDGSSHSMRPESMDYASGAVFSYSSRMAIGEHHYHMVFSDGTSEVRFPPTGEMTFDVARADYAPVLSNGGVDNLEGARGDTFTFSVRYKDIHGDPPVKGLLVLDGSHHNMTMVGTDIKKGVELRLSMRLGLGDHSFHFESSDGRFDVRFPADEGSELSGLTVRNLVPVAQIYSPEPNSEHSDLIPVTFNASGTHDGDLDELEISWSSDIDGPLGSGLVITRLLSAGNHIITLEVVDGFGGSVSTNMSILVVHYEPRLMTELSIRPDSPEEGETVSASFKVTNTGNLKAENVTLTLSLDGSTLKREFLISLLPLAYKGFSSSFTATPGEHQLLLWTTSAEDVTLSFEVPQRPPPVASAGEDVSAKVGEVLRFDASGSTSAGQLTYFHWTFDDGSNATGRIVDHIYMLPGTYNVTLAVKDDLGRTGYDGLTVTVTEEEGEEEDGPEVDEGGIGPIVLIAALVVLVLLVLAIIVVLVSVRKRKEGSALSTSEQAPYITKVPPGPEAASATGTALSPGPMQAAIGRPSDIDFLFAPRQTQPALPQQPPETNMAPTPAAPPVVQTPYEGTVQPTDAAEQVTHETMEGIPAE